MSQDGIVNHLTTTMDNSTAAEQPSIERVEESALTAEDSLPQSTTLFWGEKITELTPFVCEEMTLPEIQVAEFVTIQEETER